MWANSFCVPAFFSLAFLIRPVKIDVEVGDCRGEWVRMRGEIERPSVYTVTGLNSAGKIILLRGPELFYLVSFDHDSVDDLLAAFDAYREWHLG